MTTFSHISVSDVAAQLDKVTVADIRDPNSFAMGHMQDAVHLTNESLASFIAETPKAQPVVVVCYHGISSQQAAQFLVEQGFETVYSMDGGYEAWRNLEANRAE